MLTVSTGFLRLWKCATRILRRADLRFSKDDEAAFRATVNQQVVCPLLVATSFIFAVLIALTPGGLASERQRLDSPFMWEVDDPRTTYFAAHLATVLLSTAIILVLLCQVLTGWLANWNWEAIAVFYSSYLASTLFLHSAWHSAALFSCQQEDVWMHETLDSEYHTVLELIALVTGACLYFPLRVFLLWVVPACVCGAFALMTSIVGSPFPDGIVRVGAIVAFVCFFSFEGARRQEVHRREKWSALQLVKRQAGVLNDMESVKGAYQQVADSFCDVVLTLGSDGRVVRSDTRHKAFFGRSMEGMHFSEALLPCDRERFAELLRQAALSGTTQSMPATLDLSFAESKVQLIVVGTNCVTCPWLIGLHSVEVSRLQTSELNSTLLGSISEEGPGDVDGSHLSLPTTTDTGHVFTDLEAAVGETDVKRRLEHIAEMGAREHWLVGTDEIEVVPGQVLGSGGFGIVVAARFRGTPVAIKVPKVRRGELASTLASISNELRLHRHIRHPNIVLLHGACIDPESGNLTLIHELVRGVQLDHYVTSLPSSSSEKLVRQKLLLDTACALRYLHAHTPSIVHGDLSTSNLLVERWAAGPHVKMLDFGLSQMLTKSAKPLGGTLEWMAPELLVALVAHEGRLLHAAPSADVFSFGRLAYFVCAGEEPLAGLQRSSIVKLARQRSSPPLRWPSAMPFLPECQRLCKECLSFDAFTRPGMEQVQTTLAKWQPLNPASRGELEMGLMAITLPSVSWREGMNSLQTMSREPVADGTETTEATDASVNVTAKAFGHVVLDNLERLVVEPQPSGGPCCTCTEQEVFDRSDEPCSVCGGRRPLRIRL